MHGALWWSTGGGMFLMSEVPLHRGARPGRARLGMLGQDEPASGSEPGDAHLSHACRVNIVQGCLAHKKNAPP